MILMMTLILMMEMMSLILII